MTRISFLPVTVLFLFTTTAFTQVPSSLKISIDVKDTVQTIDNIGASAAWYSENIGRYWPEAKKQQLARWLFSRELDGHGQPLGIGLSAFRFNIGGGTAEQGDSSGIKDFRRRAECFLRPDGQYDWTKQAGYLWFVRQAKAYGVEKLIAFSNTPPVYFTQNGLGYKTVKDYRSNLRVDKYGAYARFLADVCDHFDSAGLSFDYISPVNEPQWAWENKYGEADQEGSPWSNSEIAAVVKCLDSALARSGSSAKILTTEAGHLEYLYADKGGAASRQIQSLFNAQSALDIQSLPHMLNRIGGHSYFTDNGDSMRIVIRERLRDTARAYHTQYWETEYSMLGDGYKEDRKGKIAAIDCALFLAKVIHDDLVYGNAAAWQLWNSWEPGGANTDTRYYLVALHSSSPEFRDGEITATKNLWAMGQYSRFVRPGMQRVRVNIADGLSPAQRARNVMVSAFANKDSLVLILLNYTTEKKMIRPAVQGISIRKATGFLTDVSHDMAPLPLLRLRDGITLPPRSIQTVVLRLH